MILIIIITSVDSFCKINWNGYCAYFKEAKNRIFMGHGKVLHKRKSLRITFMFHKRQGNDKLLSDYLIMTFMILVNYPFN